MAEKIAIKVKITGKVQGVGYRAWVAETANKLGLYGFVRNRLDGSVEGLFVGAEVAVHTMQQACEEGPKYAVVDNVLSEEAKGLVPAKFQIKPTV